MILQTIAALQAADALSQRPSHFNCVGSLYGPLFLKRLSLTSYLVTMTKIPRIKVLMGIGVSAAQLFQQLSIGSQWPDAMGESELPMVIQASCEFLSGHRGLTLEAKEMHINLIKPTECIGLKEIEWPWTKEVQLWAIAKL